MSHRTLLPGHSYSFLYPSINFECLGRAMQGRRLLVKSVRDMKANQLDEKTIAIRPFTKRGRWLVTGLDLDKFEERSFYVESLVAVMEIKNDLSDEGLQYLGRLQDCEESSSRLEESLVQTVE